MDPNLPLDQAPTSSPLEPTTLQDVSNRITASDVAEGAGVLLDLAGGAVEILGGIAEVIGGIGDL